MASSECPIWIDPDNSFRLDVNVRKYVADGEYGVVEMSDQQHDVWLDRNWQYTLTKFNDSMATKIIWGPSQALSVWAVDSDSGSEWKIRRDEHFAQLIKARWDERVAALVVDVVSNDGQRSDNGSNFRSSVSGVTTGDCSAFHGNARGSGSIPDNVEGTDDNCSSPPPAPPSMPDPIPAEVDWATLTIEQLLEDDGFAHAAADEDKVYEAMGFQAADERAEEAAMRAVPIPSMSAEMTRDMEEAAVPVDDGAEEEPLFDWDRDNPDMLVGTIYPSMKDFRLAVKQHAIKGQFELLTPHSDRKRFRGDCAALGCPWIIRARTQHDGSVRIQINSGNHKCASTSRIEGGTTMASQAWVEERAIPFLKRKPNMGPRELQEELQEKYKIDIAYQTVVYGKQRAYNKLYGKMDDSFDWLYRFKAEVEMRSPRSVLEIDTETVGDKVHFKRFFCCFKAAIDGFRYGCRPYISIDSTALNGHWNGHLPSAQALDGHNWMYPLAFGLFDSETKQNWTWFMEKLCKAFGPMENLAVCTDACKGLETAVANVFPNCEQRECFRHLMENMKKYYSGDVYCKNMWPAARAYTPHKFNYFFGKVLEASPDVATWLSRHHSLLWARSKFSPEIKCDYINNNLAESWNAWIKDHKDLPVHVLADKIREKTLILFAKRRKIANALSPGILPAVIYQLNAASRGLGNLKVTKGHPEESEVTEIYKDEEVRRHVVYMRTHICTCREWQVTGKPCPHALAVITTQRQPDMGQFVHNYYSVERFQAAYRGIIPMITDKGQWPEVDKGFKLLPPTTKTNKPPGRIKKKRHLAPSERSGKATRQVKCTGCGEYGHRTGSWRCPLTGTKKRKRTKKTAPKPGRKKKSKTDPTPSGGNTPRTRMAIAKEAALKAAQAAQDAAAKARAAAEAAAAAEKEVLEVEPIEIEHAPPEESAARRSLCWDLQIVAESDDLPLVVVPPSKKMTPRRKILATKKKKSSAKKGKSPAKKGKK